MCAAVASVLCDCVSVCGRQRERRVGQARAADGRHTVNDLHDFRNRNQQGFCLVSPSTSVDAAMHLMYYMNDKGERVYTLKVRCCHPLAHHLSSAMHALSLLTLVLHRAAFSVCFSPLAEGDSCRQAH